MLALTTQLAEYLALHSKSCAFLTTFPSNRQVVLLVTGGTACHWWYCLSQMVLLVTGGTACHRWYCLSLVVLLVTGGTACHRWYCLSLVLLLVTGGTACHWYCLSLVVLLATACHWWRALSSRIHDSDDCSFVSLQLTSLLIKKHVSLLGLKALSGIHQCFLPLLGFSL